MSSSSSATAAGSRSPSPLTPPEFLESNTIPPNVDFDMSSWFQSNIQKSLSEDKMLHLDELIEQDAYDDDSPDVTFAYPSPPRTHQSPAPSIPSEITPVFLTSFKPSNLLVPSNNGLVSIGKPAPQIPRPRKREPTPTGQTVVFPPKDSCYNLPIVIPSIPPGGTKSRVETQVRITVELADAGSVSVVPPYNYDKVGSWKWLRLPPGTATKKRTRKQGKIDPLPEDILHLTANVTCASAPLTPVLSCTSCQTREAKRVAKKVAARIRPAKSDSDSPSSPAARAQKVDKSSFPQTEDTTSIIQFNCADTLDFSTGSIVLPLRITCYCRHHREKVGFNVHFSMLDSSGRVVGSGMTRPIMITDDHKTSITSAKLHSVAAGTSSPRSFGALGPSGTNIDWEQNTTFTAAPSPDNSMTAPSKRRPSGVNDISHDGSKIYKRSKPYDSSRSMTHASNAPSPDDSSLYGTDAGSLTRPPTPPETAVGVFDDFNGDIVMTAQPKTESVVASLPESPPPHYPLQPRVQHIPPSYLFYPPALPQQQELLPPPLIHRLIPAQGPTHGGIEITILGANFHPSFDLKCVFGDVVAGSTQRWSDNALVCVLPPREAPGVVGVWFDGWKTEDAQAESVFTYSDESDRALMELALQVVGLKMTGKIEDAKNVAMRIVGNAGNGGDDSLMNTNNSSQIRQMFLLQSRDTPNFETLIVDFLAILDVDQVEHPLTTCDAISYCTTSGQSLLHLASLLGLEKLVQFLVARGIDLDARDRNGYTALHFASLIGQKGRIIKDILLQAGADREIVNIRGRTAHEESGDVDAESGSDADQQSSDDEEAAWGDGEEDATIPVAKRSRRSRRQCSTPHDPTLTERNQQALQAEKIDDLETVVNEKQTAWFVNMLQRTFAQLHVPANFPQLQMPPKVLTETGTETSDHGDKDPAGDNRMGAVAIRAAQEWKNSWEKWLAQAVATIATQTEELPPPMYTPRVVKEQVDQETPVAESPGASEQSLASLTTETRNASRQIGYADVAVPDTEVDSYAYQPSTKHAQKLKKKQDRMLLLFWLPVLLIALLWGFHEGVQFTFHAIKEALPILRSSHGLRT